MIPQPNITAQYYPQPRAQQAQWPGMPMRQNGFPGANNRLTQNRMANFPGAQDLLPPLPPGVTPEQLAQLQSMMTPEMMQQAAKMMQDPKVQAMMAQVQDLERQGKLTPQMMQQLLGAGGFPGMPGLAGMMGNESMGQLFYGLAKTGALACLIGFPIGMGVDILMKGVDKPNGFLERSIKWIEGFRPVKALNQTIENRIRNTGSGRHLNNLLFNLDGGVPHDKIIPNYVQAYVGPKGHLKADLKQIFAHNSGALKVLNAAKSSEELTRFLQSSPVQFLPKEIQAHAQEALSGGNIGSRFERGIRNVLAKWFQRIKPAAHPNTMTLGQLDKILAEQALKAGTSYRPVVDVLRENAKGLVNGLNVSSSTTLAQVEKQFAKDHILERLMKTPQKLGNRLSSLLSGITKRLKWVDHQVAIVQGENGLRQKLMNRNVGPVGRFMAKLYYYFHRIYEGATFSRGVGKQAIQQSGFPVGRLLFSALTLGFAIGAYKKAPKESKIARFTDTVATGIGGWYGYEAGRNLIYRSGILTSYGGLSRFFNKPVFGFLPFRYGGLFAEFLGPMVVASAISYALQKVTNLVFGNPAKIEEALEREKLMQANPQLAAAQVAQQQAATQEPKPPVVVNAPPTESGMAKRLSSAGLTPEIIMNNSLRNTEDAEARVMARETRAFASGVWNPNAPGGH